MDKRLTVDIPGAAVFALKEPDENGYFYTTIAPNLYFEFLEDESEQIYEMILHQAVEMVRKDEENEQLDDIPEEFQPYIGKYYYEELRKLEADTWSEGFHYREMEVE